MVQLELPRNTTRHRSIIWRHFFLDARCVFGEYNVIIQILCKYLSRCTASTSFTDRIFIISSFLEFYSWHLFVRDVLSKNRQWIDSLKHLVFSILGIIGDFTLSPSFSDFLTPIPVQTIFLSCTAAINALLTGFIVGKIILHNRSISKSLGNKNIRWSNVVVSTMIESSALFSICAIATAVTFGNNDSVTQSNANLVVIAVASQMTVS